MTRTRLVPLFGAALMVVLIPIASISASATGPARPAAPEPPTPSLIERAVQRGDLDRATADGYMVAALRGEPLPAAYSSDTPFRGTLPLLELRDRLERLGPGAHRRSLRDLLHPVGGIGTDDCGPAGAGTPLPNTLETPHFYIEYNATTIGGGLTIADYVTALETAWSKEVDQFGWAPPPPYPPNPAPNSKYPVRVDDTLGPTTYGFVANSGTHAGFVGNNPATPWNEGDAYASCMVLNSNYDPFPGEPLSALQATSAHEFNHSIQFGWGALAGTNVPDRVFIEGATTWIEDEVFDESNDNYNFLWPVFEEDMGQYRTPPLDEPYAYWVVWRAMTEPYGTGAPGGGEDIFQRFWELTSKNESNMLDALERSLQSEGTSLGVAYHSAAVALKFNKPCGGGYQPPHCLEEGPAYVAAKGPTATHGSVAMNATFGGSLLDNYALNWIELPQNTGFQGILKNTSGAGRFRASVACDTGTGFVVAPFDRVVGAGETAYVRSFPACPAPIAVVTNVTQTAANPPSSALRPYSLTVGPPPEPTNLSLRGRAPNNKVIAKGKLTPADGGDKVEVVLLRRKGGWKEVQGRNVKLRSGGTFRTRFKAPDAKRCRLEARFEGDLTRLPSSDRKAFRC